VLVTPDQHRENLYELPPQSGHAVHDLVREVAIAVRQVYECGGAAVRRMARSGA
jgi:histidine triad (HIT) family protein